MDIVLIALSLCLGAGQSAAPDFAKAEKQSDASVAMMKSIADQLAAEGKGAAREQLQARFNARLQPCPDGQRRDDTRRCVPAEGSAGTTP